MVVGEGLAREFLVGALPDYFFELGGGVAGGGVGVDDCGGFAVGRGGVGRGEGGGGEADLGLRLLAEVGVGGSFFRVVDGGAVGADGRGVG